MGGGRKKRENEEQRLRKEESCKEGLEGGREGG